MDAFEQWRTTNNLGEAQTDQEHNELMKQFERESGAIAILRLNAAEKKQEIKKTWNVGAWSITYHWRSKHNMWGRFGGGWNWKLGFQASSRMVVMELLVFSLIFKGGK